MKTSSMKSDQWSKQTEGEKEKQRQEKEKQRQKVPLGFNDTILALSIRFFGGTANKLAQTMPTLGDDIMKSNFFISPQAFLSLLLFCTSASSGIAALLAFMFVTTRNPFFALGIFLPIMVFGVGLTMPKTSQSGRAAGIENELAFVIGYLSVLITGGISPVALFRRLSTSKIYPATAKEAKRILLHIDLFGMDPMSAIERAARYNPNQVFADFLAGYMAVLKLGGDIRSYMDSKQKEIFSYRTIKLKSATEFVGTMAEAYLAATVVLGTSIFIIQAVQAMLQKSGFNFNMIIFFAGIFMPIISILFIFLLHSAQTKEPISNMRPYYLFGIGVLAIPVILFAPISIPIYAKVSLGLAISTAVPAFANIADSKKKQAVEMMLPSFLRDLAEVRKTGLAPEKGIQQLASRNYGLLSKSIKRMSNQLSWGVPLSKVMGDLGKDVKSWFVRSIGFLMLEVIEIGGGTAGMFNSLAEFAQRSKELEKERKSMFRPYIFIPYFGAILTIVSTVVIMYMLTNQISSLTQGTGTGIVLITADISQLTNVMFMATIFQAWTMGLVAGKMGEWSVAAGFKHATALSLIGLLTIYMILSFYKVG